MTNPKRGEMQIKLGETTYKARVTLNSIITIETSLGMGMFKIMQKLTEGDLSTSDMIQILKPIIRGGGNDISEKDIMAAIWDAGLAGTMSVVADCLATALNGGSGGNAEAEGASP